MKLLSITGALIVSLVATAWSPEVCSQESTSNYDHLKILEPFLGRWVYEGPVKRTIPDFLDKGTEIRAELAYRWAVNRNAIVLEVTVHPTGKAEFKTIEMIGWDVRRQMIVSGSFNSSGGMSFGSWTVEGDKLTIKVREVSRDSKESKLTVINQLEGSDKMIWSETQRVTDGEERPDSPQYEFKRVEKMK